MLTEAEKRQGPKAVELLVMGIVNPDADIAKLSQGLLTKNLQHQSPLLLKAMLKHDRSDVRIAAAQAIGAKKLRYGPELIALLQDGDDERPAGLLAGRWCNSPAASITARPPTPVSASAIRHRAGATGGASKIAVKIRESELISLALRDEHFAPIFSSVSSGHTSHWRIRPALNSILSRCEPRQARFSGHGKRAFIGGWAHP